MSNENKFEVIFEVGSGNIFADIGLEDADELTPLTITSP
jgi:hypothetical protein